MRFIRASCLAKWNLACFCISMRRRASEIRGGSGGAFFLRKADSKLRLAGFGGGMCMSAW